METRANYVAVGAFVLILLSGVFIAMIWLLRLQFNVGYDYYETHFEGPVTGIGKGSLARLNGIEVGRVDDIDLDPDDPKFVVVILQLREGLEIHADAAASVETQGLAGATYVEISGGTKEAPLLVPKTGARYAVIPSKPSSFQAVFNSAPEVAARLVVITDRLAALLSDENRLAFSETLVNLRDMTGSFSHEAKELDPIIADVATVTRNLSGATDTLRDTLVKVDRAADQVGPILGSAGDTLSKIDRAAEKIDPLLASAGDTVKKVNQMAGDLAQVLAAGKPELRDFATTGVAELTELLSQTRMLVANLSRVSAQLDRDPTRLLFGDRRQGFAPK